jgi:hypothetical protein
MGAVSVSDMTDDELELLADAAIARMLEVTRR